MRLLFCGSHHCKLATFKRLLLLTDEIGFLDRPALTFGNWGLVGTPSPIRDMLPAFRDQPVGLSVYQAPHSGPANDLFLSYVHSDLGNSEFRRLFLEGLAKDEVFTGKFLQMEANYGECSGADIRAALVRDSEMATMPLGEAKQGAQFRVADSQSRRDTLRVLLVEASAQLTTSMVMSEETGLAPVADDMYFARLLALRNSDQSYVGGAAQAAPLLGMEIAKAIIPDAALEELSIGDVLDYRKATKDAYCAWTTELNRLEADIDGLPASELQSEIPRIIASKVAPRITEYRNEMRTAADRLFGDLIKKTLRVEFPAISVAYLANLPLSQAIVAFLAGLAPALPVVVDYVLGIRKVKREHAVSYLVGLTGHK